MSAATPLRLYARLLTQTIREPAGSGLMIRLTWFLGACGLGALVFGWYIGKPRLGCTLFVALASGTAYLWCGAALKSAVQQNHPAHACLVPQLRVRLMTLTAALYAACTVATAAMLGVVVGYAGYALVGGGLYTAYMFFAQRYLRLALLPSVLILVSAMMNNRPLNALLEMVESLGEPLVGGVALVAVAVLCGLGLRAAFPQGGDSHWAWRQRYEQRLLALSGKRQEAAEVSRAERWWQSFWRTGYLAALRRDSRDGAAQGGMMMHTLGPSAHVGGCISFALLTTAVTVLATRYFDARGDVRIAVLSGSLMQLCVLMVCLFYVIGVTGSLGRNAAEQRLYCLTAGAPAAHRVNRVLAATLLRRFLVVWLVALACVLCIDFAILGRVAVRGATFGLAMLMLPLAGAMLRNYAAMPATQSDLGAIVVTVLLVMAFMMVLILARVQPAFPWYGIGGAVALATAVGLCRRWRRLMALPPVLPAGRLAH